MGDFGQMTFESMPHLLTALVLSPLLGILILAFIPSSMGQWLKRTAIIASLLPILIAGYVYANFNHNAGVMQFVEKFEWTSISWTNFYGSQPIPNELHLQYALGVDGISLPLVFLTALVAAMAMFASVLIKKRWKLYFILMLILEIGMLGVFTAQSLTLFFVFFELTLIPMFFLIGIWGLMHREKAANQFLIFNGLGSAILFFGIIWIITTAGFTVTGNTMDISADQPVAHFTDFIPTIADNLNNTDTIANATEWLKPYGLDTTYLLSNSTKWTLFILLLVAFGIKLPMFPFHTWMLRVHSEAPASVVMIHSGILLKMGAYGLLRIGLSFFPEQAQESATWLAILGVVNLLYGAFCAFAQDELRSLLAYSSISHMGIILLGFAANNTIGYSGAVFQMISHGLISALFFMLVGSLYERTGTTSLSDLGGMSKSLPFISAMMLVAGLASLGLPGLSGFVSELMAFIGLFENHPTLTYIAVLGIILTAAYVLRGVMNITYGKLAISTKMADAQLVEAFPMVVLTAFIILIGVYPSVLSGPLDQSLHEWAHWLNHTQAGG